MLNAHQILQTKLIFMGLLAASMLMQVEAVHAQRRPDSRAVDSIRKARLKVEWPYDSIIYKHIAEVDLHCRLFRPDTSLFESNGPVIAFFHGGGLVKGNTLKMAQYCEHFAKKGFTTIAFSYRLAKDSSAGAIHCLEDVRSAIRWIRTNHAFLNIDTNQVIAAGFSAGGLLAASTAMLSQVNDSSDDLSIRAEPNAVMMWYTALNFLTAPRLSRLLSSENDPAEYSPVYNIRQALPPMLIIQGTEDHLVPYWTVVDFRDRMKRMGNDCELQNFVGAGHAFVKDPIMRKFSLQLALKFLRSRGFEPVEKGL